MKPELRSVTTRQVIRALERDGFALVRTRGSHRIYRHSDGRRVVVAYHAGNSTFPPKTLRSMMDGAGWSNADLVRLGLLSE